MPAQLVHLAYAVKYLEGRPELDREAFVRGTAFPDIRRLAGLERSETHRRGVELEAVDAEADAWQAGLLLHSQLDRRWNLWFVARGLRVEGHADEKFWAAAKIAEESEFWGKLPERDWLGEALEGPARPEELAFGVTDEELERWNGFIAWKLQTPFTLEAWRGRALDLDFGADKFERLAGRVEPVRRDPEWQGRFAGLHAELGI